VRQEDVLKIIVVLVSQLLIQGKFQLCENTVGDSLWLGDDAVVGDTVVSVFGFYLCDRQWTGDGSICTQYKDFYSLDNFISEHITVFIFSIL
jgi:hypothetical protein